MAYDVEALLELWTSPPEDDEDGVRAFRRLYADPVVVNGAELTAADLLQRARALRATVEDPSREVLELVEAGPKVVLAFRLSGRHVGPLATRLGVVPATGALLSLRVIDVLTVVDGRITEIQMVPDELGALAGLDAVALVPLQRADALRGTAH